MPTSDEYAADTSVVVPSVDPSSEFHPICRSVVASYRPALAGHAAFESVSVLTRLPGTARVPVSVAMSVLRTNFPTICWLEADQQAALFDRLDSIGVDGGAIYDALVGEAARRADRVLLTRDRRAVRTYRQVGVRYRFVEES